MYTFCVFRDKLDFWEILIAVQIKARVALKKLFKEKNYSLKVFFSQKLWREFVTVAS